MNHQRHYTVEEANQALGRVSDCLKRLREARAKLGDQSAREALAEAAPANGGGKAGKTVSIGFLELQAALSDLQEMEVVLRDVDRGLVDFPSIRDGREVYLCWLEQEDAVGYWHDLDAGYAGRRPL